jgi:regulator of PEP synthase PpsR (kinase-PPPase family)
VPVYLPSDSTGMSAETMGHALLIQFPDLRFERHLIPFISTVEGGLAGGGRPFKPFVA